MIECAWMQVWKVNDLNASPTLPLNTKNKFHFIFSQKQIINLELKAIICFSFQLTHMYHTHTHTQHTATPKQKICLLHFFLTKHNIFHFVKIKSCFFLPMNGNSRTRSNYALSIITFMFFRFCYQCTSKLIFYMNHPRKLSQKFL